MKEFSGAFRYKEEYDDIIQESVNDEEDLYIFLKPDSNDGGMGECKDLYESLYTYEEKRSRMQNKNVSPIYGFEMWYEGGEIKFLWHTKKEDAQLHLRKQLSVHFPQSEFQTSDRQFIDISPGDYMICGDIHLKRPFFEPISTRANEPYQNVFAELDNKDDTRALIQHMFQPAPPDWTDTMKESAEEYAERLRKQDKTIRGKFGFNKKKKDEGGTSEQAGLVEQQVGEKGFNVRIRIILTNPNKQQLIDLAKHLNNMYEIEFEAPSKQTLTINEIKKEKNIGKFIRKVAGRQARMEEYRNIFGSAREALSASLGKGGIYRKNVIMSSNELSNIAHIPSETQVNEAPISWSRIPSARVPPGLKDFPELEKGQKKNLVDELMQERKEFRKKMRRLDNDHEENGGG